MTATPSHTTIWKRRLVWGGLWCTVVAASLYVAAWFAVANVLQDQLKAWTTEQLRSGRLVDHGPPELSGFPGRVILTLPDWQLNSPVTAGEWRWRTSELRIWAKPWRPMQFTVDLSGTHDIGGLWAPLGVATTVTATQAELRPTLALDGRIAQFETALSAVNVATGQNSTFFALESGALSVTRATTSQAASAKWRIDGTASKLSVPGLPAEGPALAGPISVRLSADLEGAVGSGPLPTALEAWRERGGALEVREVAVEWPPLSVVGSGTFALDDNLQPIGAMTATFRGFFETVDALKDRGVVRPTEATIARSALSLFARTPNGSTQPELNLSVTVQNQKLYTGPVTLMTLPPIVWPETVDVP